MWIGWVRSCERVCAAGTWRVERGGGAPEEREEGAEGERPQQRRERPQRPHEAHRRGARGERLVELRPLPRLEEAHRAERRRDWRDERVGEAAQGEFHVGEIGLGALAVQEAVREHLADTGAGTEAGSARQSACPFFIPSACLQDSRSGARRHRESINRPAACMNQSVNRSNGSGPRQSGARTGWKQYIWGTPEWSPRARSIKIPPSSCFGLSRGGEGAGWCYRRASMRGGRRGAAAEWVVRVVRACPPWRRALRTPSEGAGAAPEAFVDEFNDMPRGGGGRGAGALPSERGGRRAKQERAHRDPDWARAKRLVAHPGRVGDAPAAQERPHRHPPLADRALPLHEGQDELGGDFRELEREDRSLLQWGGGVWVCGTPASFQPRRRWGCWGLGRGDGWVGGRVARLWVHRVGPLGHGRAHVRVLVVLPDGHADRAGRQRRDPRSSDGRPVTEETRREAAAAPLSR